MSATNRIAKGQAAIEVLAYASFFLLVFVMISSVFFAAQEQELTRAENAYAQEIAYGFSDSVRTSFIAGNGFSQTIELPPDLLGKPYTIRISTTKYQPNVPIKESGFVYVDWQGQVNPQSFSSPLVANYFTATGSGDGFIKVDQPAGTDLTFITIDPSLGASIKLVNTIDQDGKSIILVEPPDNQ